jgi:predicted XRE-type DNA-binding protein
METLTTLHRLKHACKRRGITQQRIATVAGVTRQHVCHVFAGRLQSRRILTIARQLLADPENQPKCPACGRPMDGAAA